MKVKELIEILSKLDHERFVVTFDEGSLMNVDLRPDWIEEQTLFKKDGDNDYLDSIEDRDETVAYETIKVVII